MPCYNPRNAGFDRLGNLTFSPKNLSQERPAFKLPCGQCIGCRLERSREWAVRCDHEAQMHNSNCYITLTYKDSNLPKTPEGIPTLFHKDFQDFMKKLRKKFGDHIGVFMCGEYGETKFRPHYHACLFGLDFSDKVPHEKNKHGDQLYISKILDQLWGHNDPEKCPSVIGELTFESAAYVARYVTKKITGAGAETHYNGRLPEYGKTSRKYAIGKKWLEKYWTDVFNYNHVITRDGNTCSIPRYYVKWLEKNHFEEWCKYKTRDLSHTDSWEYKNEQSRQRLKAKKYIKEQQIKNLKRDFEPV